jgi:PBSX family phage portal protein
MMDINTYHARCCKTKASDVAGLGWVLEPIGKNASQTNFDRLMEFFNESKPTFEDTVTPAQQDYEGIGWMNLELVRIDNQWDGEPERLEHLHAHTMRIHRDANRFMQSWWGFDKRWFKLIGSLDKNEQKFDVDMNTGVTYPQGTLDGDVRGNEVLYNTNYSSDSTYYGVPDAITTMPTIIGDQAAVQFNISFFKNFGIPNYAIFVTGFFADEPLLDAHGEPTGKTKLQDKIERKLQEVIENPHGNLVFMIPTNDPNTKVEIRFEPLAVDIKDSSFRLYRMDNRDEIVSAHMMDPYRVGIVVTGSLGGNTAIESKRNYAIGTIRPRQRKLEAYINNYIIWSEDGFGFKDWKLKFNEINIGDRTELIADAKTLYDMSGARPIDIIRKFGVPILGIEITPEMKADPTLNQFYIPANLIPLKDTGASTRLQEVLPESNQGTASTSLKVLKDLRKVLLEKVDELDDKE